MGSQESNQSIEFTPGSADGIFRLRFLLEEVNSKTRATNFFVFAQKNGSGGYTEVTPSRTDGIYLGNDEN